MIQSLSDFFIYFSRITRLDLSPVQNFEYINIVLLFLVLWIGLYGVRIYRLLFSVLTLIVTIVVTVLLFESRIEWLYVASIFSIFSVIFAFLSYFLKRLSAFFIVGLIVFVYLNTINIQLIFVIIISSVFSVIAYIYPFVMVLISTTLLSSIESTNLLNQRVDFMFPLAFVGIFLFVIFLIFQLCSNKEGQYLFRKMKGETYG